MSAAGIGAALPVAHTSLDGGCMHGNFSNIVFNSYIDHPWRVRTPVSACGLGLPTPQASGRFLLSTKGLAVQIK